MDQPSYYANIPSPVRYDRSLKPNAKLLYGEITALTNKEGFCWAPNEYFATLYDVSSETVSRWISQLRDAGYIEVEILHIEGNKRRITIDKIINRSCQKGQEVLTKKSIPLDKKVKPIYENITINNTSNIYIETAFEFLEKNAPTQLESALMNFKSKITDFEAFKTYFNNRVDKDDLELKPRVLIGAMKMLAETWIGNLRKEQFAQPDKNITGPAYMAKPLD
jgi:DNA-binding transcriptional ArsR family regulator